MADSEASNIPSESEIVRRVQATSDFTWWPGVDELGRPNPQREAPVDLSGATEAERERFLEARILRGPGPNANALQREVHKVLSEKKELDREITRLKTELEETRTDPVSGQRLILAPDAPERHRLEEALRNASSRRKELDGGPYVTARFDRALEQAVAAERERYEIDEIEAEARRRFDDEEREAEIQARMDVIRKSQRIKSNWKGYA